MGRPSSDVTCVLIERENFGHRQTYMEGRLCEETQRKCLVKAEDWSDESTCKTTKVR